MESAFADLTLKVDGIIVKLDQLGQRQKQVFFKTSTSDQLAFRLESQPWKTQQSQNKT